jgi:glycosyltransferase involved in cell wall biosynthesis
MRRATALVDPEPHRLLGREVVEAMLLGTAVVVTASGGATREHADAGDGGLWYRSDVELDRCLELVADRRLRATLGRQGREYAERRYGNPDAFIRRVNDAVWGLG